MLLKSKGKISTIETHTIIHEVALVDKVMASNVSRRGVVAINRPTKVCNTHCALSLNLFTLLLFYLFTFKIDWLWLKVWCMR